MRGEMKSAESICIPPKLGTEIKLNRGDTIDSDHTRADSRKHFSRYLISTLAELPTCQESDPCHIRTASLSIAFNWAMSQRPS